MAFEIVRNDIVNMAVDAIVNTANPRPEIGSGTDAAIHAKAGPLLLRSRRLIGTIKTGEAAITLGFGLPAKFVIHAVGPVWQGGDQGEADLLRLCYDNVLKLAWRHRIKSLAIPLISTGNYGFPKALALEIAVEAIRDFLREQEMQIYLVVFEREAFLRSREVFEHVRSFIDEAEVREKLAAEYLMESSRPMAPSCEMSEMLCPPSSLPAQRPQEKSGKKSVGLFDRRKLGRMLQGMDAGFSETLLRLIDASGKKDSEIYKKANVDRKLFSKIRNNPNYKPSKATALAFAIALELDLEQTRDLIGRAGYALTRSSKFDIIIEYFILHRRYDVYEINLVLFEFDQSLLGN